MTLLAEKECAYPSSSRGVPFTVKTAIIHKLGLLPEAKNLLKKL
jgi:hypothetical protein